MKTKHGSGDIGGIPVSYQETELDDRDYAEIEEAISGAVKAVGHGAWKATKFVAKAGLVVGGLALVGSALSNSDDE